MCNILDKRATPLCWLPSNNIVCYKDGLIMVLKDGLVESRIPTHISIKERYLGKIGYLNRFLRLGIRVSIALDDKKIVYLKANKLYELNLTNHVISNGFSCEKGTRPLLFTKVKDIEGFDDGIYFGGYLGNMAKNPVNIYHRIGVDNWEVVYTFPHGAINHVHNIVADNYRNCLWIFTGDFDEAAAIWKVTDNFKRVERVVCNNQKYRGCVAYSLPEGLLYATDAPFTDDYIYLMNTDTFELKKSSRLERVVSMAVSGKTSMCFLQQLKGMVEILHLWNSFLEGNVVPVLRMTMYICIWVT